MILLAHLKALTYTRWPWQLITHTIRLSLLCNHAASYVPISVLVMISEIRWFFNTLITPALMHAAAAMLTTALSAMLWTFILVIQVFLCRVEV